MSFERWRPVKQGLLLTLLSPIIVLNVAATEPVAEPPPEATYRQEAVWTEIGGDFQNFDQPCAVAVDYRRDVYIADCVKRAIFKFDLTGKLIDVWTHTGEHRLFYPIDIAIDHGVARRRCGRKQQVSGNNIELATAAVDNIGGA